jgi:hypothetical protein
MREATAAESLGADLLLSESGNAGWMMQQHRWMDEWDGSGSVEGAAMKVCEDCGAELIATWTELRDGKPTKDSRMVSLVYVAPCSVK